MNTANTILRWAKAILSSLSSMKNWRTTLGALVGYIASLTFFTDALIAWGRHQPVQWRSILVSLGLAVAGYAFQSAKDKQVHSTQDEVDTATITDAPLVDPAIDSPPNPFLSPLKALLPEVWIRAEYKLPAQGENVEVIFSSRAPGNLDTFIMKWGVDQLKDNIIAWRPNTPGLPSGWVTGPTDPAASPVNSKADELRQRLGE